MPFPRKLLILIEGPTDKEFFEKIIKPPIERQRELTVSLITYSEKTNRTVNKFIQSFLDMECECYLFRDFDQGPCFTQLRETLNQKFPLLNNENILIIKKEIESWILAGISDELIIEVTQIEELKNTEKVSKEDFKALLESSNSTTEIRSKILNEFDLKKAVQRNKTLRYILSS